jgi:hypothetical protein
MVEKNEWHYADDRTGKFVGPITREELDEPYRTGKIHDYTPVNNAHLMRLGGLLAAGGVPYGTISRSFVEFDPPIAEFITSRVNKLTTVLSGPNNCGKTFLLKQLLVASRTSGVHQSASCIPVK